MGSSGDRRCRLWERFEALSAAPHAVQDDCQFAGHRDDGSLLASLATAGGQLQLSLNGNAGNYYTIEYSTNLVNWVPLLITNPPSAQPLYLDFPTTNKAGFYQAYESGIAVDQSIFSFSAPVIYVNVADGVAVIPITRTNGLANDTCVNYSTSDGTAIGGCDYEPQYGTLCFAAGVTSSSVSIPVSLGCGTTNQSATVNLQLSDTNGTVVLNAILVIQRPKPVLAVYPTSLTVVVPGNCGQSITISNAGPQDSVLNYTVVDNGALSGYLNLMDSDPNASVASGSFVSGYLQAGQTAQVTFTVLDRFATNWLGGTLTTAPSIYTPDAANFVKSFVSVTISTVAQKLIGSWSGTWTGTNWPPSDLWAQAPVPVGGTWTLNLQTWNLTNPTNQTASGTLIFQGTDCYWGWTNHYPLNINLTIPFANVPITERSCGLWTFNSAVDDQGFLSEYIGDWWTPPFYYVVPEFASNNGWQYNEKGYLNFVAHLNTDGTITDGDFYITYPDRGYGGQVFEPFSTGGINGSRQGP